MEGEEDKCINKSFLLEKSVLFSPDVSTLNEVGVLLILLLVLLLLLLLLLLFILLLVIFFFFSDTVFNVECGVNA